MNHGQGLQAIVLQTPWSLEEVGHLLYSTRRRTWFAPRFCFLQGTAGHSSRRQATPECDWTVTSGPWRQTHLIQNNETNKVLLSYMYKRNIVIQMYQSLNKRYKTSCVCETLFPSQKSSKNVFLAQMSQSRPQGYRLWSHLKGHH